MNVGQYTIRVHWKKIGKAIASLVLFVYLPFGIGAFLYHMDPQSAVELNKAAFIIGSWIMGWIMIAVVFFISATVYTIIKSVVSVERRGSYE